jgi:hypothetical protein
MGNRELAMRQGFLGASLAQHQSHPIGEARVEMEIPRGPNWNETRAL